MSERFAGWLGTPSLSPNFAAQSVTEIGSPASRDLLDGLALVYAAHRCFHLG